jgi:hypothetical protein
MQRLRRFALFAGSYPNTSNGWFARTFSPLIGPKMARAGLVWVEAAKAGAVVVEGLRVSLLCLGVSGWRCVDNGFWDFALLESCWV